MTVSELIELLSAEDQNLPVVVDLIEGPLTIASQQYSGVSTGRCIGKPCVWLSLDEYVVDHNQKS